MPSGTGARPAGGLFSRVRGIGILRASPVGSSRKFNRRSAPILFPTFSRFLTPPRQAYDVPMILDNAIYVDGHRTEEPGSLQETYEAVRQRRGVAWIGLYKPTEEEFGAVSRG